MVLLVKVGEEVGCKDVNLVQLVAVARGNGQLGLFSLGELQEEIPANRRKEEREGGGESVRERERQGCELFRN